MKRRREVQEWVPEKKYKGEGVWDFLKNVGKKIVNVGKKAADVGAKAADAYTSNTGVVIRNVLERAYNPDATPNYPGEKHAILRLPNGKLQTAQYIGPGTNLIPRLKMNNPGLTDADRVAKMHDIEYTLAQYSGDRDTQKNMGRAADIRMINSLDKIAREGRDTPFNTQIARNAIKLKTIGEDIGAADPFKYLGPLISPDPETQRFLLEEHAKLERLGYGIATNSRIGGRYHGRRQFGRMAMFQSL